MFEGVVIRADDVAQVRNIDVGSLAESLLFYQNVHIFLERRSVGPLINKIGIDDLRMLLNEGYCTATYIKDSLAVSSVQTNRGHRVYGFASALLGVREGRGRPRSREVFADAIRLRNVDIPSGKIDRLASEVSFREVSDFATRIGGVINVAMDDVTDTGYVQEIVRRGLTERVPEFDVPPNSYLRVHRSSDGLLIDTNLDFDRINEIYHRRISPAHSSIDPAIFLEQILSTRLDLTIAMEYGTDIVIPEVAADRMQARIRGILSKRINNESILDTFHEEVLPETKSLREAINSGQISFSQFLKVLENARKFKRWLKGVPPDRNLIQEYYKEVARPNWLNSLSAKATRFVFFTGGGALLDALGGGGMASASLGAADAFLVDRIVGGWKPNQFIEGPLRELLAD